MTIEEAREFYFRYYGFSFHMDREEPSLYAGFRALGLSRDVLSSWDEELLDGLFEGFWAEPGRVWTMHGRVLKIISRGLCDVRKNLDRLLGEMEKMDSLDPANATLVIENMAGRTESMNDGGVRIFCMCPELFARMNEITERVIASCGKVCEADVRSIEEERRYRSAYRKFSPDKT